MTKRTVKNLSDVVLSEEDYAYDAAGNMTAAPDSTFSYDTNNRLTWYNGDAVSYDLDGNMLSAVLNGTTGTTFTYDSGNRLISAGGHTYTYNAEDVRIRNLCSGEDTKYTYNTNCKLSKLLWKETNGTVTKYVYGRGLIGEETGNAFKTYHFDCRGSTVALTDANGVITDTFEYDTYGKLISRTGTSNVIFLYNGRDGVVTDTNGLVYMRARYYSPDMRRFVNADIIHGNISDSPSLNRYAYVNGNPVSFIDPFGLSQEDKDGELPLALTEEEMMRLCMEVVQLAMACYIALLQHMEQAEAQKDSWWSQCKEWAVNNVAKPLLDIVQKALSKIDLTYSRGIGGSVDLFHINLLLQGGYAIDTEGNIVIQWAISGNATTGSEPGIAVFMYDTITNAPSVDNLSGTGGQGGVSGTIPTGYVPVLVGADFDIIPDPNNEAIYYGVTGNLGVSTPGSVSTHAGVSYTGNVEETKGNIFQVLDAFLNWILGE